ncbi:MAG: hypothetical protein Q8L48_32470 [Archangium sp.]|nr:hypothetical protein [Archangium sp.]
MTPAEVGALLGDLSRGDEVLASIKPDAGPAMAKALRKSFKRGDEQGNERRLRAVVIIEGEGALDLVQAVLEDEVVVGGIYSNLRNVALELMQTRFKGHPKLEKSLWRAVEFDEYLEIDRLYEVAAAYDASRALAVLRPPAEQGVPAAVQLLAVHAGPEALKLLDAALAGDPVRASQFIEALGPTALQPDFARRILPLADELPAAAEVASRNDPARARATADQLSSKDARWRAAAMKAIALLPAEEIFERLSKYFAAVDRAKRAQLDAVLWSPIAFEDPRWVKFLTGRLETEEQKPMRGMLVRALGKVGPAATAAIALAPKGDGDTGVLKELPLVLGRLKGALRLAGRWEQERAGVLSALRDAAASVKTKKHQKLLERALQALES